MGMNRKEVLDPVESPIQDTEREMLTSSSMRQDEAHVRGAYDYLYGVGMCARFGCIAAHIRSLDRHAILDLGCGIGSLRSYLDAGVHYHGIDIAPSAISRAQSNFHNMAGTTFELADIRNLAGREWSYDCVVWAGIGHAYGRTGGEDAVGWREVLNLANDLLLPGGLLIPETIVEYEETMAHVIVGYNLVSSWQVSCMNGPVHSRRIGWVLERKGN